MLLCLITLFTGKYRTKGSKVFQLILSHSYVEITFFLYLTRFGWFINISMIRINVFSSLFVLIIVVTVALVCTLMGVVSADSAIDETNTVRDISINSAFKAGEESVLLSTNDYLKQIARGTSSSFMDMFIEHRHTVQEVIGIVSAPGIETTSSWEFLFSLKSLLWNKFNNANRYRGVSQLGFLSASYQMIFYLESSKTIEKGTDQYHHVFMLINNGSEFDSTSTFGNKIGIPAPERTTVSQTHSWSGDAHNYPNGIKHAALGECNFEHTLAINSGGREKDDPCCFDNLGFADSHKHTWKFPIPEGVNGVESVRWSPPYPPNAGFGYMAIYAYGDYGKYNNGSRVGQIVLGVDMRQASRILKNINLKQSEDGSSKGRMFVVTRSSWWGPDPTTELKLVAVNKGNATAFDDAGNAVLQNPQNSTDEIISKTARYIENQPGKYQSMLQIPDAQLFTMTMRDGSSEKFFFQVTPLEDGFGIDWFFVIAIDRKIIMRSIEETMQSTLSSVNNSEHEVEEILGKNRIYLYLAVAGATLMFVILSSVVVIKATNPLVTLERDMAHIAVMNLDKVNAKRDLSVIAEVHRMQESFERMIHNLNEFRQFLPCSILVVNSSESDVKGPASPKSLAVGASSVISAKASLSSLKLSETDSHPHSHTSGNKLIQLKSGIRYLQTTILSVMLEDFGRWSVSKLANEEVQGDDVVTQIGQFADIVSFEVGRGKENNKGQIHQLSLGGGQITAIWTKKCSRDRTMECSLDIYDSLEIARQESRVPDLPVSVVLTHYKKSYYGNLGSIVKQPSVINSQSNWNITLHDVAFTHSIPVVTAAENYKDLMSNSFLLHPIDALHPQPEYRNAAGKLFHRPITTNSPVKLLRVYEICRSTLGGENWLYTDPQLNMSAAMESAFEKYIKDSNSASALESMLKYGPQPVKAWERLIKILQQDQ